MRLAAPPERDAKGCSGGFQPPTGGAAVGRRTRSLRSRSAAGSRRYGSSGSPRAALLLAAGLLGCGGADPPTDWNRQIAAVRVGRSEAVELAAGTVRPAQLADLRTGCERLRRLTLRRNGAGPPVCHGADFTDELTAAARALPKLERLDFDGPVRLARLAPALPAAVHLNLPAASAGDAAVAVLAASHPGLELLRLHAPGLTDAGVEPLAGLSELRFLHLLDAPLTDAAVPVLAACGRLESLYLDGAGLSADGWADLRRRRPDLHLHADQTHPAGATP